MGFLGIGLCAVLMLLLGGPWGPCGPSSIYSLIGLMVGPPSIILGGVLLAISLVKRFRAHQREKPSLSILNDSGKVDSQH